MPYIDPSGDVTLTQACEYLRWRTESQRHHNFNHEPEFTIEVDLRIVEVLIRAVESQLRKQS